MNEKMDNLILENARLKLENERLNESIAECLAQFADLELALAECRKTLAEAMAMIEQLG